MARLLGLSSPCSPSCCVPRFLPLLPLLPPRSSRRCQVLRVRCLSPRQRPDEESKFELSSSPVAPPLSSEKVSSYTSNSTYKWLTGLGGIGLVETAYLTYLKVTNSDAFCPIGGGTCGDVLNSDYAVVFGVPLPLIGMVMYGLVAALALQLWGKKLPFQISETDGRLILLAGTTSMAVASAYFLYILSTELSGATCSYCLLSALLSFSLFFLTLKDVKLEEMQRVLGLQICVAGVVVAALTTSYNAAQPVTASTGEIELPYYTTKITSPSSPFAIALARHLHSIGAKMYGAFWCSHCLEQKQMFGGEASKLLDYVECFPDGYKKGTKITKACLNAGIEGFPTWVINGEVLSGEKELNELAKASGFGSLNEASS